ncbi:hypothetical protein IG631_18206 [Alternaria alternata]|nr:hypothetical protein IG631_18206 [Alternaria alternata]
MHQYRRNVCRGLHQKQPSTSIVSKLSSLHLSIVAVSPLGKPARRRDKYSADFYQPSAVGRAS